MHRITRITRNFYLTQEVNLLLQAGTSARKNMLLPANPAERLFLVTAVASRFQHSGCTQRAGKVRRIKSLCYLTLKHMRERVKTELVIFVSDTPFLYPARSLIGKSRSSLFG